MDGDSTIRFDLVGIGSMLNQSRLAVPVYQRSYAWTTAHIEDFCSDLQAAFASDPQEYFLGTIVLSAEGSENRETIIDGQQRLATTFMLLAALRDYHLEHGETKRADNLHNLYIGSYDDEADEDTPHLLLNAEDQGYFRARFVERNSSVLPTRESHRLLSSAYTDLLALVTHIASDAGNNWVGRLVEWRTYLQDRARVVYVQVPSESDAFMIFETLNDRGADLTLADLLKNYLFGRAGDKRLQAVRDHWMAAQAALDQNIELFVTFIRHYWSSLHGPTREHLLYKAIKAEITSPAKSETFAKELEVAARLYAALLSSDHEHWTGWGTSTKDNLETLVRLGLEQNRPMLLAALQGFSKTEVQRTLRATVSWSVRGLIVGGIGGGTTEKAYASAAVKIRDGSVADTSGLLAQLQSIIPSDSEFQAAFSTARVTKASLARYYLNALERTEAGTDQPELVPNANEEEVNLEHVLPRTPKKVDWPNLDEDEAKDLVNRLGNQALLKKAANTKIGNQPFAVKKPILAASDLSLTNQIGQEPTWGKSEIEARQEALALLAVQTWPREKK
jgi:hypothetical protein